MEKFVYAFSEEDRDYLLKQGFTLIQSDEINKRYTFENISKREFASNETDGKCLVFSNTLTF